MKVWNKYTRNQKIDFCKKYKINDYRLVNNILSNHFRYYKKYDWALLKKYGIINGVGNFLVPKPLRILLTYLLPFIRFDIHDLNCSLGGGFNEYFNAHRGIIKYGFISIYKHFRNGYLLKGIFSFCFGIPIILLAFVIVVLFSWTSFNFIKLEYEK